MKSDCPEREQWMAQRRSTSAAATEESAASPCGGPCLCWTAAPGTLPSIYVSGTSRTGSQCAEKRVRAVVDTSWTRTLVSESFAKHMKFTVLPATSLPLVALDGCCLQLMGTTRILLKRSDGPVHSHLSRASINKKCTHTHLCTFASMQLVKAVWLDPEQSCLESNSIRASKQTKDICLETQKRTARTECTVEGHHCHIRHLMMVQNTKSTSSTQITALKIFPRKTLTSPHIFTGVASTTTIMMPNITSIDLSENVTELDTVQTVHHCHSSVGRT